MKSNIKTLWGCYTPEPVDLFCRLSGSLCLGQAYLNQAWSRPGSGFVRPWLALLRHRLNKGCSSLARSQAIPV
jgi:hypothetical protein